MSNFSDVYGTENETIHRLLREMHHDITRAALKRVHDMLMILHSVEASDSTCRSSVRQMIEHVESLRTALDDVLKESLNLDVKIKLTHGCNGECGT